MLKYTGCYSRTEIESLIPPKDAALICIHDPDTHWPAVSRAAQGWDRITFHRFWDTTYVPNPNYKGVNPYPPASEQDLLWLMNALLQAKNQHCFVSCEAGISRSAAVREYLFRRGWQPWNVSQKHRMVHPNVYILASLERLDRGEPLTEVKS